VAAALFFCLDEKIEGVRADKDALRLKAKANLRLDDAPPEGAVIGT
jgi:hypothetical protein